MEKILVLYYLGVGNTKRVSEINKTNICPRKALLLWKKKVQRVLD